MTKEEIFDHLADVYLGKKKKKRKAFNATEILLFVNIIVIAVCVVYFAASSFYRFKERKPKNSDTSLALALNYYPLHLTYNFSPQKPQVENFSMHLGAKALDAYNYLGFSIKGSPKGYPRIIKVGIENAKREKSYFYYNGIEPSWKEVVIPLSEFKEITDWSRVEKVSFVLEAWNVDMGKGMVVVDDVCFYKIRR